MLLRTYLTELLGLNWGSNVQAPHSLMLVDRFLFGPTYQIRMVSGMTIQISGSETILAILHDELKAAPTYSVRICTTSDRKWLCAIPKNELGRTWGRNLPKLINEVRMALTDYNLSDTWPKDIAREVSSFEALRHL